MLFFIPLTHDSIMEVARCTPFVTETFQYVATYLVHTNVRSQTIIYPNPNPNPNPNQKKISNLRPETLTLFVRPPTAVSMGGLKHNKKG